MRRYSGMYYLLKEIEKKEIYMKTLTQLHTYTYNVYTCTAYVHTKPDTRVDKYTRSFVVVFAVSKYTVKNQ